MKCDPRLACARFVRMLGALAQQEAVDGGDMDRLRLSCIVVLIVTAATVYAAAESPWKSYETAIGGSQLAPLGNGPSVKINTNSELRSRISKYRHDIVVVRGEALFQVPHDAGVPFVIDTT